MASFIDFLLSCTKCTVYIDIYLYLFNSHKSTSRYYDSHFLSEEIDAQRLD